MIDEATPGVARWRRLLVAFTALVVVAACSNTARTTNSAPSSTRFDPTSPSRLVAGLPYLHGVNVPWHEFGSDIGCAYDAEWFERTFATLESAGINSIRFWLHADGRCSPTFASDGTPTGLPSSFFTDLDDFLRRANSHHLAVVLVLWAHPMVGTTSGAFPAGHHRDLITSAEKTQAYIDRVLVPIVERYDAIAAIAMWEVMNEPELTVGGIGDRRQSDLVAKSDIQRFVGRLAAAVHDRGGKPVTTGSTSARYLVASTAPADRQWWTDAALISASGDRRATLDVYEVHYYDYLGRNSPWNIAIAKIAAGDGKQAIIGEFPLGIHRGITRALDDTFSQGYAGAMAWAYNDPCCGAWSDVRSAIKIFAEDHRDILRQ